MSRASSVAFSFALAASAAESTCWAALRSHPDDMCRCRRAALTVTLTLTGMGAYRRKKRFLLRRKPRTRSKRSARARKA